MTALPTLYTPRLVLRPFTPRDAPRVMQLAGDPRVAATTLRIPHPYPAGEAERFIGTHRQQAEVGNYYFAVTLAGTRTPGREHDFGDTGHVVGTVSLGTCEESDQTAASLGYWMGTAYWNKGFATEAARAVLAFGFRRCGLHRVTASHLAHNTASGRVMQKLGMLREGVLRQAIRKEGDFHDLVVYGLLENEWNAQNRRSLRMTPAEREVVHS